MYFSILHKRRRFIWQLDAIVRLRKGLFNESREVSKPESSQVSRPKSSFFENIIWITLFSAPLSPDFGFYDSIVFSM